MTHGFNEPETSLEGEPVEHAGNAGEGGEHHLLSEQLTEVQKQRDEYLDQLQRTRAEFMNFQKRSRVQAEIDRQYATGGLALDLLNVMDNLDRAIDAARSSADPSILAGLELVQKQFLDMLSKHGVQPIEALGQPFDPSLHEALLQQPDPESPEGTVIADLGRGYKIHDRVLRPSKVAVSTRP